MYIVSYIITVILDVDECTSGVPCEHMCINTEGSFQCSCRTGYTLDSDGSRCNGQ